jgi:hypothetical protein
MRNVRGHYVTQRWARILLRSVGILAVLLAIAGLLYTAASSYQVVVSDDIDQLATEHGAPYIRAAFYVMASICVAFYLVLLLCGVRFVLLHSGLWWLFTAILAAEVLYYFSIGYWFWPHPTLGRSIAGATGISSGGLMFQFLLLFPLWAPVAVYLARRSENRRAP